MKKQELLFEKTGPNPAFISIDLLPELNKPENIVFAYSEKTGKCFGSYNVLGQTTFLPCFGNDNTDSEPNGFAYLEPIKVGIYIAEDDEFVELTGKVSSWGVGDYDQLKWISLGLFKFKVESFGNLVQLEIDPELSEVSVTTESLPQEIDVYHDDHLFFNVKAKNASEVETKILQGFGTLQVVNRYVNGHSYNRQYIADERDGIVVFKTTAVNDFTGEEIESLASVIVKNSKPAPIEDPGAKEITVLFDDGNVKIYQDDKAIWVENLTDNPIVNYITCTRIDGRKVGSNIPIKGGKTVRALFTSMFKTAQLKYYKMNGITTKTDKTIEL